MPIILRVVSLILVSVLMWHLLAAPSLKLRPEAFTRECPTKTDFKEGKVDFNEATEKAKKKLDHWKKDTIFKGLCNKAYKAEKIQDNWEDLPLVTRDSGNWWEDLLTDLWGAVLWGDEDEDEDKPAVTDAEPVVVTLMEYRWAQMAQTLRIKVEEKREEAIKSAKSAMKKATELAKFDLQYKVYPEIKDRSNAIDDWVIQKMLIVGGLLGAFLLQLAVPLLTEKSSEDRRKQIDNNYSSLLDSAPVCVVLGLATLVCLFMDIHIRKSLLVIHQLGAWAGEYGALVLGGSEVGFPGWEQFLRLSGHGATGMHNSFIDVIQTTNLSLITMVLFAVYHWTFQGVCLSWRDPKKYKLDPEKAPPRGLDEFNRLTYLLIIFLPLLVLVLEHYPSGNFAFQIYSPLPPPFRSLFSDFKFYCINLMGMLTIFGSWDLWACYASKRDNYASKDRRQALPPPPRPWIVNHSPKLAPCRRDRGIAMLTCLPLLAAGDPPPFTCPLAGSATRNRVITGPFSPQPERGL